MPKAKLSSRQGFTLVELMISMGISVFVFAGVITAFLFLGRTGMGLSQYNDMEAQARMTFQVFGQDCRKATDADWTNSDSLQLIVEGAQINYTYDAANGTFTRNSPTGTTVLADDVTTFSFKAFDINTNELDVASAPTAVGDAAKMIQVDLDLTRQEATTVTATQRIISARFVLRNKKVS